MEAILDYLCAHADQAHLVIVGLLLLAGLNMPFSEDLLVIAGGMITATCVPERLWLMFSWIYAGCVVSAYIAYSLGRLLGPHVHKIPWIHHAVSPERVESLGAWLRRFGLLTFFIGRMIPFGVRNALFITCGLSRMPFLSFAWRDALSALFSTSLLFYLGFLFGGNYETLVTYLHTYEKFILLMVSILAVAWLVRICFRKYYKTSPKVQ